MGYVVDALEITRPRRSSNPSSATSWTAQSGLEINAVQGAHRTPAQNVVLPALAGEQIGASVCSDRPQPLIPNDRSGAVRALVLRGRR